MQVDVSEARSRAFSLFLRFLHLGISLLVAQLIAGIQNQSCSSIYTKIGFPIAYILIALNVIFILVLRCRQEFNRKAFFVGLAIDIILVGVSMVLGLGGIGEANGCANNKVLHRFAGFSSFITLLLTPMTLLGPFDWAIRYTNAPGNMVWPFLFFAFSWTSGFNGSMIVIGLFNLLLSLGVCIVNLLPIFTGVTTRAKKIIRWGWLGGLGAMALCEVIALIVYLANSESSQFNDMVAKKLLQTFLVINVIDGLFWLWGILTLRHSGGDSVREGIMEGNQENEEDYNDLDNRQGFGTVR